MEHVTEIGADLAIEAAGRLTTREAEEIDMDTQTYTDQQATDEAVLLLTRKLRRLHPAACTPPPTQT